MQPFVFTTATEIRFGRGAAFKSAKDIARMGKAILLVHGAEASRSKWLRDALEAEGCDVIGYSVPTEPDVDIIEQGVAIARSSKVELICSLGGGAVIDAGKAIAALVPASRSMFDHLEVVGKGLPLENPPLQFVAIPTTSGTGAEVTRNAVIGVPEHKRKVSLRDARMLPDLAIVDPGLTDNCPRNITLASGLDAITQVIEPFLCLKANAMSDALCRDSIPRGLKALVALMEYESQAARDEMAWVSLCGGLALANAGLGAVHGLAGPLGGLTGSAHGALCGAMLPYVLRANHKLATDPHMIGKFGEIAGWISEAFKLDNECSLDDALQELRSWSINCGLPTLGDLGVTGDIRTTAAQSAGSSSSMQANPVKLSCQQLEAIMEAAA